jgi:hypothetical protein
LHKVFQNLLLKSYILPRTSQCRMINLYLHSSIRLHGIVLNYLNTGTNLSFFTSYCSVHKCRRMATYHNLFSLKSLFKYLVNMDPNVWKYGPIKYRDLFCKTCYIFTTREFGHLESTDILTLYSFKRFRIYENITRSRSPKVLSVLCCF